MNQPVTAEAIMRQSRGESTQATAIEQSRAVAEVQAAVTVAQARPRDESLATEKAIRSCGQRAVAETAFFRFPRGGQSVSGESVHLARELARCWGNIFYGISELSRDDGAAMSEMVAFAWDLETNSQSRMTFQVPHKRDKRGGAEVLTDMRDIYENNANMGARRLRECIFAVLPPYLKEAAKQTCLRTLEKGEDGKPLQIRVAEAIAAFEGIGIAKSRLEAKVGKFANWTEMDVAQLQVSYRSIQRREVSADEEFPRAGVEETVETARAIAQRQQADRAASADGGEGPAEEQRGEGHAEVEGDAELRRLAIDTIRRAATLQSRDEFDDLEMEIADRLSEMPPTLVDEVNAALDEAQTRIARAEKKGAK